MKKYYILTPIVLYILNHETVNALYPEFKKTIRDLNIDINKELHIFRYEDHDIDIDIVL